MRRLIACCSGLLPLVACVLLLIGAKVDSVSATERRRPNFVIILTDDQDVVLNGMTPMKNTQALLGNAGVTFSNAFTSSPLCCPSRASLLTGQYAHNHRTHNNSQSGGCYAQHWRNVSEPRSMPVHFAAYGYRTFYAGKYLNEYRGTLVPAGWSQWFGLNGNSRYYNYTLTENGVLKRYGEHEYLTDVLGAHTVNFLAAQAVDQPFLAVVAPPSAHAPFTPAPRHRNRFLDVPLMQTPNFNRASAELDKHWLLAAQQPAQLSAGAVDQLRRINIARWQTLLAVDEMVADIVSTLATRQLLDNTYVLFTSDNGFHLGQFAQGADKRQPYETDVRVPLMVRGPGVRPKSTAEGAVALVDVLGTLLDLAGIEKPVDLDGTSFVRQVLNGGGGAEDDGAAKVQTKRQILVQHWGEGDASAFEPQCPNSRSLVGCDPRFDCHCQDTANNTYSCLRQMSADEDILFCEFNDNERFSEAYDLQTDPYQLDNIAFEMLPSLRYYYSQILQNLGKCLGTGCQQIYP